MSQPPSASIPSGPEGSAAQSVTTVVRSHGPDRFELLLDGSPVGVAEFVDIGAGPSGEPAARVFFHTEVDPAYGGRGLAGVLVTEALDATREEGLRIVPVCPFVKLFVRRNDAWADLVDPVTQAALDAIPASP